MGVQSSTYYRWRVRRCARALNAPRQMVRPAFVESDNGNHAPVNHRRRQREDGNTRLSFVGASSICSSLVAGR
jgi:hypothetical protein